MKKSEQVKIYKVGNSQVVRIPAEYKVPNKSKAEVYCDNTPNAKLIVYKFPKKHHYKNVFKSKLWRNMTPDKTHKMTRELGFPNDSGTFGNERWHYNGK